MIELHFCSLNLKTETMCWKWCALYCNWPLCQKRSVRKGLVLQCDDGRIAGAGDTSFFDTDFNTETLPMSGRFRYWYWYQEKRKFRFRFRYWYQSQTSFITKILMKCPKSLSGVPDFSKYRIRYWYWYLKFSKIDTDSDTRLSSITIPDRFR